MKKWPPILAGIALVTAMITACVMPPCPIDEIAHYSVAFFAAKHGRLPTLFDVNDPEIMALYEGCYPSPPTMRAEDLGPVNLFAVQYEAVHPPLSYVLWSLLIRIAGNHAAIGLLLVRLTNALALAAAVWITALMIGRQEYRSAGPTLTIAMLLSPAAIAIGAYANNAPLALMLGALVLCIVSTGPAPKDWSPSRAWIAGSLTTLLALTFWYSAAAVLCLSAWFALALPRRRLALAALPLITGGLCFAGYNLTLYGRISGLAIHREIVSYSYGNPMADVNNLGDSLRIMAQTLILPEFFPPLSGNLSVGVQTLGFLLLGAGALSLIAALRKLGKRGLNALALEDRGAMLGTFGWHGMLTVVVLLPFVTGGGAMLSRYLVPGIPFLAVALAPAADRILTRLPPWKRSAILVAVIIMQLAGWTRMTTWYASLDNWGRVLIGRFQPANVLDTGLAPENNRHIPGGIVTAKGIEQRFPAPTAPLTGIRILLCTFRAPHISANYIFELEDPETGTLLIRQRLHAHRIRDWEWYTVEFPALDGWQGKSLRFRIRPQGQAATPITVQLCTPPDGNYSLEIDGQPADAAAVFQILVPAQRTLATLAGRLFRCYPPRVEDFESGK